MTPYTRIKPHNTQHTQHTHIKPHNTQYTRTNEGCRHHRKITHHIIQHTMACLASCCVEYILIHVLLVLLPLRGVLGGATAQVQVKLCGGEWGGGGE